MCTALFSENVAYTLEADTYNYVFHIMIIIHSWPNNFVLYHFVLWLIQGLDVNGRNVLNEFMNLKYNLACGSLIWILLALGRGYSLEDEQNNPQINFVMEPKNNNSKATLIQASLAFLKLIWTNVLHLATGGRQRTEVATQAWNLLALEEYSFIWLKLVPQGYSKAELLVYIIRSCVIVDSKNEKWAVEFMVNLSQGWTTWELIWKMEYRMFPKLHYFKDRIASFSIPFEL